MIRFVLNGDPVELPAAPHETLLDVLRREHVLGCRESCGIGVCGVCSVIVDHHVVASCIMLAQLVDGAQVETIEGIGIPGSLNDLQEAFIREAALQCGFCTPAMVLTATQLLRDIPRPSDDEIALYLAGNICRCGAYPQIIDAIKVAAGERAAATSGQSHPRE